MPKQLTSYVDFSGGLNTDVAPDNMADNELEQADNAFLDPRGSISKRRGTEVLNEEPYEGDEVEQLIEWAKDDGSTELLAVIDNKLYSIDPEDGGRTEILALARNFVGHIAFQNRLYFVDGEEIYVYDGSSVSIARPRVFHSAPVGGPFQVGETITGGNSAATATIDLVGDGFVGVSNVTGAFEDGEVITGGTSGAEATITEIQPGVAADNVLGSIAKSKFLVRHGRSFRIFAAGVSDDPAALYFSEPNDPTYFKAMSKLYPTHGDGPVTALATFADAVLVFFKNSIWAFKGVDPSGEEGNASWTRLPVPEGTVAPRSLAHTPNSLTFLGEGGLYAITPAILFAQDVAIQPSEETVPNLARNRVVRLINSIVHPETAAAVWDRAQNRYMLAYGDDSESERNNRVLVLHWGMGFTRYTGWNVNDFLLTRSGEILFGTHEHIVRTEQGYTDRGEAIEFRIRTKAYHLGDPVSPKKLHSVFLLAGQFEEAVSSADVEIISGYRSVAYQHVGLDESFVWGDPWGDVWGWTELMNRQVKARIKGLRFQVMITNKEPGEPIAIYGLAFFHKQLRPRGVKVGG